MNLNFQIPTADVDFEYDLHLEEYIIRFKQPVLNPESCFIKNKTCESQIILINQDLSISDEQQDTTDDNSRYSTKEGNYYEFKNNYNFDSLSIIICFHSNITHSYYNLYRDTFGLYSIEIVIIIWILCD